jgi:hypothetical protein
MRRLIQQFQQLCASLKAIVRNIEQINTNLR